MSGRGNMGYVSTRDSQSRPTIRSFEETLLRGLAEDGGLFVPQSLPLFEAHELRAFEGLSYDQLTAEIVAPFVGSTFGAAELSNMTRAAYRGFRDPAVVPVVPLVEVNERLWLLELFHGPTLAFKDLALQLLGLMFDAVLARRGEHVTIVGATSGDTGSAAMAACRDRTAIDIFILYPRGRISDFQRRQMTTIDAPNAHAIAIEGTFDDCQDLVKALFADQMLRQEFNLSAVNSINFARIAAQIVYYFSASIALGGASGRTVSFSVPTGNFGNIYAGHLARLMGIPIRHLIIGTNKNDILARYVIAGDMSRRPVDPSASPSMDIQIPSNFERLLYDLKGRDGNSVTQALRMFRSIGRLPADDRAWQTAQRLFRAHSIDDKTTIDTIASVYASSGKFIDPHTAVGVAAAQVELAGDETDTPMVALACAHPAKFPETVTRATGTRPPLPPGLDAIVEGRELDIVLPNDLGAVKKYLFAHARRAKKAA